MVDHNDDRAREFAYEYFTHFNFKKAYLKVFGYEAANGYMKYANSPRVQKVLEEVREEIKNRRLAGIEDVVNELTAVAFSDVKDAVQNIDAHGIVTLKNMEQFDSRFIKTIKSGTHGNAFSTGPEIQTHDKIKALELLSKLFGSTDGDAAMAADAFRQGFEMRDKYAKNETGKPESKETEQGVDAGLPPQ